MGHCAVLSRKVHHGGMRIRGSGGVIKDGIGAGGDNSYSMRTQALIDAGPPWVPTPGFTAYNNQNTYYATGLRR